ncbi:MAG: hypothetical protein J1E61_07145 [Lachnospiraceae bacterium]|nr:hypothetical protein [Lachnospiraceae bacterium]
MLKRHVIKILCVGVVLAGLLYGCGQAQPEAVDEDLNVVENVLDADDESEKEELASPLAEEKTGKKIEREIEKESETKSQSEVSDTEIIGTWATTFDYAALIEMELGNEYADFHEDFDLTIYLDFHDDGTFEMYADEEEVRPTLQKYFESLAQYVADLTYEEFDGQFSKAEVDEMFGMSIYDYLLEQFVDAIDAADITGEMYVKGVYAVEGDHLLMDEYELQSNIYDIYAIEGDTLTLTLPEGAENDSIGIANFDYPYVFTRVAE